MTCLLAFIIPCISWLVIVLSATGFCLVFVVLLEVGYSGGFGNPLFGLWWKGVGW